MFEMCQIGNLKIKNRQISSMVFFNMEYKIKNDASNGENEGGPLENAE